METENLSQPTSWPILAGVLKFLPIAQALGVVLCAVIAWYVATQANSYSQTSRIEQLEKRADASDKTLEKVLTKEVFEAYHQGDIERADRLEKLINQLIADQRK